MTSLFISFLYLLTLSLSLSPPIQNSLSMAKINLFFLISLPPFLWAAKLYDVSTHSSETALLDYEFLSVISLLTKNGMIWIGCSYQDLLKKQLDNLISS